VLVVRKRLLPDIPVTTITDYPHRREGRSSAFVDDDIHVLTPIRGKIQRIKTT